MTRELAGTCVCIVLGSMLACAQAKTPATPAATGTPDPPLIKLTGCVTQGAAPKTFKFENAKINGKDPNEPAKSYILVPVSKTYDFTRLLNHRVTITGSSDYKTALNVSPGDARSDKDLPTFTARHVANAQKGCQ